MSSDFINYYRKLCNSRQRSPVTYMRGREVGVLTWFRIHHISYFTNIENATIQ